MSVQDSASCFDALMDEPFFFQPTPVRCFSPQYLPKARGRKRKDRIPYEFDKKHENARQSVLRYFKKNMRKLLKACGSKRKAASPSCRAKKVFCGLYPGASADQFEQMATLLYAIKTPEVLRSNIRAKGFKSCCNAYVEWLFESSEIKALYELHTTLAASLKVFDKILKLPEGTTEEQRTKVLQFIYDIPVPSN